MTLCQILLHHVKNWSCRDFAHNFDSSWLFPIPQNWCQTMFMLFLYCSFVYCLIYKPLWQVILPVAYVRFEQGLILFMNAFSNIFTTSLMVSLYTPYIGTFSITSPTYFISQKRCFLFVYDLTTDTP